MEDLLTILVVDDEALDRLAVRRALHEAGFAVSMQEAETCTQALDILGRHACDAAFFDYSLPDGTALSLIAQARAIGVSCPLLVLTGQGDETVARDLLKAGADDYLSKVHLTAPALGRCLRGALRSAAAAQAARHAQAEMQIRDRAMDAARCGIVITDARHAHHPLIYCNEAFRTMTGYAAHEIIGRNCRFLQGPGSDPEAVAEMRRAAAEGHACQVILKNYRRDGTAFWNEVSLAPVRDAQGTLTHFIGIQSDITALKWAEDERLRLLEQTQAAFRRERKLLQDILASVTGGKLRLCDTSSELPLPLPQTAEPISLAAPGGVRELRRHAERAGEVCSFSDARCGDLAAAVGEAAMNAMVHGGGGMGRVHADPAQARVQVWIEDQGSGITLEDLPRATLERGFTTIGTMGHGFWIVLRTSDRCWLLTGPEGTTVVLEHTHETPGTHWPGIS